MQQIVEERESEDDIKGVDSIYYALKECEHCQGTGYVAEDDGGIQPRQKICGCVLEARRRHACEVRIKNLFGQGSSKMTLSSYLPGSNPNNQQALRGCLNYVQYFDRFKAQGVGFGLVGESGGGKTHLVIATLIALLKRWPGKNGGMLNPQFASVPELLRLAKKGFSDPKLQDIIEKVMLADICLLDDIGAEYHRNVDQGMSWVDEQLYIILDYRLNQALPTLYTTNLNKSALKKQLDPRIVRRLDEKTAALWPVYKNPTASSFDDNLRKLLSC